MPELVLTLVVLIAAPTAGYPVPAQNTEEVLARKARSEARLVEEGVPVNKTLPVIHTLAEANFRSGTSIGNRAVALGLVAAKADHADSTDREIRAAAAFLSPKEKAFIYDAKPTRKTMSRFVLAYESLDVMLWALSYSRKLTFPREAADPFRLLRDLFKYGPQFASAGSDYPKICSTRLT
jgi:hypothetical protein